MEDIEPLNPEEHSKELTRVLEGVVHYLDNHGVTGNPTDAPAFWLLDHLTNADEIVKEFISCWPDYDVTDLPNGDAHQMYYLAQLHQEYGDRPIDEVVREVGLLKQFRNAQMRNGQIRIDEGSNLHGLGFRGLLAIAPDAEVTRQAIKNVVRRYNSANSNIDNRIMTESALGLLEYDYESYREIVDSTTDRVAEDVQEYIESGVGEYLQSSDILLLAKNPTYTNPIIHSAVPLLYSRTEKNPDIYELGYYAEVGIAMLAAGHGPTESSFHANWRAELHEQRQRRRLPKFVSTQPTTAVENRRTEIKQQIEQMIEDTQESLYISTRGIGMLHHDLLDLLEDNPDVDFRVLTNRKRASGDRKKFKRAAMEELAKRTGTGVKQSKFLHARMVVSDEQRLLVSNADFTRDQLHDSFNAGIYTEHPKSVKQAVEMFETAWDSGKYLNP